MEIHRKTKSVQALLDFFRQRKDAANAIDLVELFKEEMNKATVYRIVSRLEADGIIHSFKGFDGLTWYAPCKDCKSDEHHDCHPHFQCRVCGKTECLDMDVSIPSVPNHNVDSAELLFTGQCEDCLK